MKLSIILTTYNRITLLPRALDSILKQTHPDIEVLVIDDGSTDGTEECMEQVRDARVRYIKLDKNSGASIARNRGIQEAVGDYILVWDSDDELYKNTLEKILSVLREHPEVSIVSAPARVLENGKEKAYPHFPTGEVTLEDVLCKKLPSNEKVRVARTDVMKQVSYKSRNIDFLVNVELIEKGKWYHIDEVLGDVYTNTKEGSLTSSRKKRNIQYAIERAPHLRAFLRRHGSYLKKINAHRYADYCYGAAIGSLLGGDVLEARRLTLRAVSGNPMHVRYWGLLVFSYLPGGRQFLSLLYR